MNTIFLIFLLFSHVHTEYVYAPELIRGNAITMQTDICHVAYIDGGDWQALQVGTIDTGIFIHLSGATIDNNNLPVPYRYEKQKNGKSRGYIMFRGHRRKICVASSPEKLNCR